ncbi:MAG: hypothetical protein EZS28_026818 [Streblomastix strix]|uniref:Uncharacterized protein n=1 Tax=Streblomastix strix TaxID=222440 RepID=A0A5J4V6E4_9EUKA|nr:MAG: hypothetical protein EZS28_026818 [Streblomastix strix]
MDLWILQKTYQMLKIFPTIAGFINRINNQRRRYCSWLRVNNAVEQRATFCIENEHALGEQLYRCILIATGLAVDAIEIVIGSMILEIWRKRRVDIHILNEFFENQKMDLDKLRQMRADVTQINVLIQINNQCRNYCLQDLRKKKIYKGIALAIFFNTDEVSKSSIIIFAAKKFELAIWNKSKQEAIQDLDLLLSFIAAQQEVNGMFQMDLTKALFVAFTALRMMELARTLFGGIDIKEKKMGNKIKVMK